MFTTITHIPTYVACLLQALNLFVKKPIQKLLIFGPENAGKSCLVDTQCISCIDIFIVKLITNDCGFQFLKNKLILSIKTCLLLKQTSFLKPKGNSLNQKYMMHFE